MELGVRIIGLVLRILKVIGDVVFAVVDWLMPRPRLVCPADHHPLLMCSGTELARRIRAGEVTSEEVVSLHIERMKTVNVHLNALSDERYSLALEEARQVDRMLDEARRSNDWSSLEGKPFLGVPFTVKESCSLEGMCNSVGCVEWRGRRAAADGGGARALRGAGAVPLGVSATPELCLGWETTSPLRPRTNNPYDLRRTPAGSSGGEAALIASGASPFGIASDIAGSIRIPAAFCGVFGYKPTPGIIDISGHIPSLTSPLYSRLLCCGPIVRRAEDLRPLARVLAAPATTPLAPATTPLAPATTPAATADPLRLDEPVDFRDLTVVNELTGHLVLSTAAAHGHLQYWRHYRCIYYMNEAAKSVSLIETSSCIKEGILKAVKYLEKECGCKVSEKKFKKFEHSVEMSISVFFSMEDIPNLLADPANPKRDKSLVMELLKQVYGGASRSLQALGFALIKRDRLFIPSGRTEHYVRLADQLRQELVDTLSTDGVLLCPVFPAPAHGHGGVFVRASGVLYTMLANVLGAPAVVAPLGLHRGLPVALQIMAAPNQDRLCIAVAEKLEEAFGGWQPVPSPT